MRNLLTRAFAVAFAALFLSGSGGAQQAAAPAQQKPDITQQRPAGTPAPLPEITSTRIAAGQIARVQADPVFKAAMESLEEQGEVANLASGQVLRSRSQPGITEYSFDITVRGSREAGEYSKLVYSEQTGKPAFVYFDGNCTVGRKAVTPQPSEAARSFAFCLSSSNSIGCGACVAQCPNGAAQLFTSAKVSHLALLPQGQPERLLRVESMVARMEQEGFGTCSNFRECEAVCPKEVSIDFIAWMNADWSRAKRAWRKDGPPAL